MKPTLKTILLTLFFLGGGTFIFCGINGCDKTCEQRCRSISGITITAIDNADSTPHAPNNGQLYAKALLLSLEVTDTLDANNERCTYNENPFVNTSIAMMKSPCANLVNGVIRSYIISSNNDFDPTHTANSSLNDLFYIPVSPENQSGGDFQFYLLREPAIEGDHIFTITIVTNQQDTLITSTQSLKLLKQ